MLFAGWEVRTVKNCDRGLENAAFSRPRSQFFSIRTDLKPVNNLFIFSKLSNEKKLKEKNSRKRYLTVVRGRIRTALRTNQIVGFVTVPAWKKIILNYFVTVGSSDDELTNKVSKKKEAFRIF